MAALHAWLPDKRTKGKDIMRTNPLIATGFGAVCLLSAIAFAAHEAAYEVSPRAADAASEPEWRWAQSDSFGYFSEDKMERAELAVHGNVLRARLFAGDQEHAEIEGVLQPASAAVDTQDTMTTLWNVVATEKPSGAGGEPQRLEGSLKAIKFLGPVTPNHWQSYKVLTLTYAAAGKKSLWISQIEVARLPQSASR